MSRRTVKIELPTGKPDEFIKLCQDILAKDTADGEASVLDEDMVAQLTAATTPAATKNQSAKQKDAEAQLLRQDRDTLLGLADGQTAETPDTALNAVAYLRDQLELKYRGSEETLGLYGFKVIVGTAKSPTKKPKPS